MICIMFDGKHIKNTWESVTFTVFLLSQLLLTNMQLSILVFLIIKKNNHLTSKRNNIIVMGDDSMMI